MKLKSIYGSTHYRISDADAGKLARGEGKSLPGHGRELRVKLPSGQLAWLRREHYPKRLHTDAPKREWIWIVWDASPLTANARRAAADQERADELKLFIDNEGDIYRMASAYRASLEKKAAKGNFDLALAAKGFGWIVEEGAKKYAREFGADLRDRYGSTTWSTVFTPATRDMVAKEMAQDWWSEYKIENGITANRRRHRCTPNCPLHGNRRRKRTSRRRTSRGRR